VIRRLLPLALSLVAVATLASCGTFSNNHEAASVNGVALDRSDLELYTRELFAAQDGTIPADQPREVLTNWVIDELIRQYLTEQDLSIDDATIEQAKSQVESGLAGQQFELSEATRSFLVDSSAARLAFSNTQQDGALLEFADSASVVIDPRYGRWDLDAGAVLALG
jgi:hypothetical protein